MKTTPMILAPLIALFLLGTASPAAASCPCEGGGSTEEERLAWLQRVCTEVDPRCPEEEPDCEPLPCRNVCPVTEEECEQAEQAQQTPTPQADDRADDPDASKASSGCSVAAGGPGPGRAGDAGLQGFSLAVLLLGSLALLGRRRRRA